MKPHEVIRSRRQKILALVAAGLEEGEIIGLTGYTKEHIKDALQRVFLCWRTVRIARRGKEIQLALASGLTDEEAADLYGISRNKAQEDLAALAQRLQLQTLLPTFVDPSRKAPVDLSNPSRALWALRWEGVSPLPRLMPKARAEAQVRLAVLEAGLSIE